MAHDPDWNDETDADDVQHDTYLTFQLGTEEYAVSVVHVTEIIRLQGVMSRVPGMADCYRGVLNLRSKVVPVMDVRTRFHLAPRDYDDRTVVVVLDVEGSFVGLVVDAVTEVAHLPPELFESAPEQRRAGAESAIQAIAKRPSNVTIILDARRLIKVPPATVAA